MRIGLAVVVVALAATPTTLAVAEKPRPDALWKAFPLDPASKRPASPLLPPVQGRAEARAEATTVIEAPTPPTEATRDNLVVLAFATLVALLSTVVVLAGRRMYVRRHRRASSFPLWQGVALPHTPDNVRQLHKSGVRASNALVGRDRRAVGPHPDVAAPRYRWADKTSARRFRPSAEEWVNAFVRRVRKAVWTEDTAPAIVGGAVAVLAAFVLIYLIG